MHSRCFFAALALLAHATASEEIARSDAPPTVPAPAAAPARPPPNATASSLLNPVIVYGQRYVDPFEPIPRFGFRTDWPRGELPSFSYETSPVILSAARAPQFPQNVAPSARVLLAEPLRAAPALTLAGALRGVPGFELARRDDSFSANPVAQGISLRGLGAGSGLVLLDGVPLNDPFDGGVAWAKVPRDALARAEVISGGGAAVWGNAALGGLVQLFTRRVRGERVIARQPPPPGSPPTVEGKVIWGTRATLHARTEIGDYGTRSLEFSAVYPSRPGTLQILSRIFGTDGFPLVASERRGPIDTAAWSRHRWVTARWHQPIRADVELTATARGFEEQRGGGTPGQRHGAREKFASLALAGQAGLTFRWDAVAYAQEQSSASTFSTINAARTAETPAADQFAVPSFALGAAWTGTWKHEGDSSVNSPRSTLGADLRFVRGETRENLGFAAGSFTRQRVAGGAQRAAGLYGLHERTLGDHWRATAGVRLDALRDAAGDDREWDRRSGVVFRDDHHRPRDEVQLSPSAGLVWTPNREWRLRASGQQAFRRPTLHELYRSSYRGSDFVEANAALDTERVASAEIGGEWTLFVLLPPTAPVTTAGRSAPAKSASKPAPPRPPAPTAVFTLGATAFHHDLRDAVGEITLVRIPGTFSRFNPLAASGVDRQRTNLERTRIRGLELAAKWTPLRQLTITGDFLFNDATIRRAAAAPALAGKRVAHTPRRSALLGGTWRAPAQVMVAPRLRYLGRQFADHENQATLGAVVIADLGISRALNPNLELFLTVENLGNARIETGRSTDGVVNVGAPRLAIGGLRGSW